MDLDSSGQGISSPWERGTQDEVSSTPLPPPPHTCFLVLTTLLSPCFFFPSFLTDIIPTPYTPGQQIIVNGYIGARAYPKPPRRTGTTAQPASATAVPDANGVIPPFIWQPHRDEGRVEDEADARMEMGDADAPPAYQEGGDLGDGERMLGRGGEPVSPPRM